jgi:hypothetical protein
MSGQRKKASAELLPPADSTWSADDWRRRYEARVRAAEDVAGMSRVDADHEAFRSCIAEFLNANPSPSTDDRCAWCEKVETAGTPLLPYGTEPGTHAWLHAECWEAWYRDRCAEAVKSLANMGVIERQWRKDFGS